MCEQTISCNVAGKQILTLRDREKPLWEGKEQRTESEEGGERERKLECVWREGERENWNVSGEREREREKQRNGVKEGKINREKRRKSEEKEKGKSERK